MPLLRQGDDLKALIDADQKAAKAPQCAMAGCSTGTKYVYCDAQGTPPG
ncbi:hypothetical protein [Pyxidicoccus caerfyrddinensis]|nr:hypothetical protein [Pyxidicoccus caerfyrddinensis]